MIPFCTWPSAFSTALQTKASILWSAAPQKNPLLLCLQLPPKSLQLWARLTASETSLSKPSRTTQAQKPRTASFSSPTSSPTAPSSKELSSPCLESTPPSTTGNRPAKRLSKPLISSLRKKSLHWSTRTFLTLQKKGRLWTQWRFTLLRTSLLLPRTSGRTHQIWGRARKTELNLRAVTNARP